MDIATPSPFWIVKNGKNAMKQNKTAEKRTKKEKSTYITNIFVLILDWCTLIICINMEFLPPFVS